MSDGRRDVCCRQTVFYLQPRGNQAAVNPAYVKPAQESDDLLGDLTAQFGPPYRFIRQDRPILNELFSKPSMNTLEG